MLTDLIYLNRNQNSPINKITLLTHYLKRLMFSTSTCDNPYTDNLDYLLLPHTLGHFVEHVGFEPLFFRAREICYQLHHTPRIIKNTKQLSVRSIRITSRTLRSTSPGLISSYPLSYRNFTKCTAAFNLCTIPACTRMASLRKESSLLNTLRLVNFIITI